MTKKHFQAMAAEVRELHRINQIADRENMAGAMERERIARIVEDAFVHVARQFNGHFDERRFREACQLPEGKE